MRVIRGRSGFNDRGGGKRNALWTVL
jgi:hypothetical protein